MNLCASRLIGPLEHTCEMECASFTRDTLSPYSALHHLGDLSADRQPQSGAPKTSCRGSIHLLKSIKNSLSLFLGNADPGIPHVEMKLYHVVSLIFHSKGYLYLPFFSKFCSVAQEIEKHLSETCGISFCESRHCIANPTQNIDRSVSNAWADEITCVVADDLRIEINEFETEMAGFYFGKIENVIYE